MLREVRSLDQARHSPHVARKRQARMRAIVRTAFGILASEGRAGLTLKRVAEREGLTSAALYRYFSSKDALVAELQCAVITSLANVTRDRVAMASRFALDAKVSMQERAIQVVAVSGFVFEEFSRTSPMEFGFLSTDLSSPEFTLPNREAAQVFEVAWEALSDLANGIAMAKDCGAIGAGDENERAVALWAGLQGVVQTKKLARSAFGRIDSTEIAKGLVSTLLVGWGADRFIVERVVDRIERERLSALTQSDFDFLEQRSG